MAKQIIRLTESDLHRMIRESVDRILKEGWKDSYDKWSSGKYENDDDGEKLNRKWNSELKAEHPDKKDRRSEFNKHTKSKDSSASKEFEKKWKASGGEERFKQDYKKKYGVDINDED